jgi:chromosome partitioning protein
MPIIISISIQKGGCGKTTTAVNLAGYLALDHHKKVLVIDADPQANASSALGFKGGFSASMRTLHELLRGTASAEECAIRTRWENLDLIAGSMDLMLARNDLDNELSRETLLKRSIEPIINNYDYILIDTPPDLGLYTTNAWTVSDWVLIPLQAEIFPLESIMPLTKNIARAKNILNPNLKVLGAVMTMFDGRMKLQSSIYNEIKLFFREQTFTSVIYRSVRVPESQNAGEPLCVYCPTERVAKSYSELTEEVLERVSRA